MFIFEPGSYATMKRKHYFVDVRFLGLTIVLFNSKISRVLPNLFSDVKYDQEYSVFSGFLLEKKLVFIKLFFNNKKNHDGLRGDVLGEGNAIRFTH